MSDMTIDEVKKQGQILEATISELISKFENDTGVSISGINLDKASKIGYRRRQTIGVRVTIEGIW